MTWICYFYKWSYDQYLCEKGSSKSTGFENQINMLKFLKLFFLFFFWLNAQVSSDESRKKSLSIRMVS